MKESNREAERWWLQAENDLNFSQHGFAGGFYAQTCFQCHQVADKAMKALHFGLLGERIVVGHSLLKLGDQIGLSKQLMGSSINITFRRGIPIVFPMVRPSKYIRESRQKKRLVRQRQFYATPEVNSMSIGIENKPSIRRKLTPNLSELY